MICSGCNEDRKEADFFGKLKCYKCIFKEKTQVKPKVKQKGVCKICGGELPFGRRKFCGEKCIEEGQKLHNQNYWIRNINCQGVEWN